MELTHIGVERLQDLATRNLQLSMEDAMHLDVCEGCSKVLTVFRQQMNKIQESEPARPAAGSTGMNFV